MAGSDNTSAFTRAFGRQLKLFRERAGLTQAELGARVGYSADQIASVECGRRIPKPDLIDKADEVLSAGGILKTMKEQAALARYPAFFRDAAQIEAEAVEMHVYDTHVINGLLQTDDYANAMFVLRRPLLGQEIIDQGVAARLARQTVFSANPAPIMSFVMEESVLRKPYGGRKVLRGQLEQLLLIGEKRNVEIQVMPTAREDNAGIDGPFTLMVPKKGEQVAYLEGQGRGILITDREEVRSIAVRYGIIRAQALNPRESLDLIEGMLGEL
ncbi:helix-turn-helix transcriptional regulator [Streptomyces sp. NBRC 110028]|uniref:helix-turn-helix domain-containing protein n=1 Tax=Streptomyces sp. NBRC 110028 TaxID=1621260 RepID=UPI0006E407C0|nr:helix-turn-helix transcriptional regulator [Streptomyces sp. NBRC 110028]